MSDMQRIERAWLTYRAKLPTNAGATQLQETRRAFYAGCWAFYTEQMGMFDKDHSPTVEDLRKMTSLVGELEWFRDKGEAGLA